MNRREALRKGAALGMILLAERIADAPAVEAAGKPPRFYNGGISGGSENGWMLWIGIAGKRSRGFVFDPSTVGGSLSGFRMGGSVHKNQLALKLFDVTDVRMRTPIGSLGGTIEPTSVRGAYGVAGETVEFNIPMVPVLSPTGLQPFAGTWSGAVQDGQGQRLFDGNLLLRTNGTYKITKIGSNDGPAPKHLSGWYGIDTTAGMAWVYPTPALIVANSICDQRDDACPPIMGGAFIGDHQSIQLTHPFGGCIGASSRP